MALNIKKNYLTKNRCYIAGTTCVKRGIQIHTIGTGQGTAQSVADYWNQGGVSACVHYCVDADVPRKVLQFLPETIRSWADAGWGNNNLITVEICESDYIRYTGGANYTVLNAGKFEADIRRGYATAVELCAKICMERGWNPLTKLSNGMYLVSSHLEGNRAGLSSNHGDPDHVWSRFGLSMDGFRKDVAKKIKEETEPELKPGVKVKLLQDIYIRTEPSTKTKKGGYTKYTDLPDSTKKKAKRKPKNKAALKKGTVVSILEVKTAWDKTKWIKIKSGWLPVVVNGNQRVTKA